MRVKKMSNILENKILKVVRVSKKDFELDTGDIYPLPFVFDEELTIEEFQKILDNSKNLTVQMLKTIEE